ncbi:hypothetical protein Hamer_G013861 [Homarus americanus]|uniref:Uncharacterized protein n=1 Tax=Homarus americanus TaxID=6706 RepID=A0A8J5KF54_HOMAM|nr:hypothetical protein Hamer_G013861 [Homarus americanus]
MMAGVVVGNWCQRLGLRIFYSEGPGAVPSHSSHGRGTPLADTSCPSLLPYILTCPPGCPLNYLDTSLW